MTYLLGFRFICYIVTSVTHSKLKCLFFVVEYIEIVNPSKLLLVLGIRHYSIMPTSDGKVVPSSNVKKIFTLLINICFEVVNKMNAGSVSWFLISSLHIFWHTLTPQQWSMVPYLGTKTKFKNIGRTVTPKVCTKCINHIHKVLSIYM